MNPCMLSSAQYIDGPLKLKDVECFKASFINMPDEQTRKYVERFNQDLFQRRINTVNAYYKQWLKIWPQGTPLHFFAALNTYKLTVPEMETNLRDEGFKRELIAFVGAEADKFKQKFQNSSSGESPKYSPLIDLSPEDRLAAIKRSQMPDIDKWTTQYYNKVVRILKDSWDDMDKNVLAESFKWTLEQCEFIYEELKKRNAFDQPQKRRRKSKEKRTFTGIMFIKDGITHRIGQPLFDPIDQTQNPLRGYCDPLTNLPFHRPMICPYGYVLDYDTWRNRLQYHLHPYQQVPFTTMQSLTDLTVKNYDEYKDKIRNAPFSKYIE